MPAQWLLTFKPSFLLQLNALPSKEVAQISKKLTVLTEDPTPDGHKVKKKVVSMRNVFRLRAGDYRVFYTFKEPYISLLRLDLKGDDTYETAVEGEDLGGLDAQEVAARDQAAWDRWTTTPKQAQARKSLPVAIDQQLLENLKVPSAFQAKLLGIATEDDLLAVTGVPDEVLLRVSDALVGRPMAQLLAQPDLVAQHPDDLIRFREGELLGFLLRLDPEQEKFVTWAKNAKGPTLLKGGPGTGKSTVAIYRARTMLEVLAAAGNTTPRLLFTTYTKALVTYSSQLLQSLLGDAAGRIEVRTADSVAMGLAGEAFKGLKLAETPQLRRALDEAIGKSVFGGNSLQQKAQAQTIERLGRDYLLDELTGVIQARDLATLESYQATERPGREQSLHKTRRQAVWTVYQGFVQELAAAKLYTWQMLRARAAAVAAGDQVKERYDGVIVDECQDLDPTALRMLVALCAHPGALFLTADANQSIYGAGFRWKEVHDQLRFVGRTGVLCANHRSTREIGEAAHDYLQGGALDADAEKRAYVNSCPLPAVRAVAQLADEVALLARFLPAAAKELRLTLGACAVFCPGAKQGQLLVEQLATDGVPATYMTSADFDLNCAGVKVLSLKSAKGLEFPIVALGGFSTGGYPYLPKEVSAEQEAEILRRERRTMFVAMTRAMRALLVIVPTDVESPLLQGFTASLWNLGAQP